MKGCRSRVSSEPVEPHAPSLCAITSGLDLDGIRLYNTGSRGRPHGGGCCRRVWHVESPHPFPPRGLSTPPRALRLPVKSRLLGVRPAY